MPANPDIYDATITDLAVSPLNVRFNERDACAVDALAASIVAEGLLQPLLVHPAPTEADWASGDGERATFGVLAGGRRYRAICKAIANDELPADFLIRCHVRDLSDAEIVLLSLSENLLRRDLNGYEVHAAIARLSLLGMTEQQIAHQLGQEVKWVQRQARLGTLHPPIFEAYCAGSIDVEQARAFGATEDLELQAIAWDHFERKPNYVRLPTRIRQFYKVGDFETAKLIRFVGAETYRSAGGRYELDLFNDVEEQRGRVLDEDLLAKLSEAKLKLVRAGIKEKAGWRDLTFAAEPPKRAGHTDTALEIHVDSPADLPSAVPADTPDQALVATIAMTQSGSPIVRFWWSSRKAKAESTAKPAGSGGRSERLDVADDRAVDNPGIYSQDARAIARDAQGLSATSLEVMRTIRRDVLRWGLLQNWAAGGRLANDLIIFSLLRQELGPDRVAQAGMRPLGASSAGLDQDDRQLAQDFCQSPAREQFEYEVEQLIGAQWITEPNTSAALEIFVHLDRDNKARAAAVLAGLMLLRSVNSPGFKIPIHDTLAQLIGLDASQFRRSWTPDSGFAGLFPKMKRMELVQPFVEARALKSWTNYDDRTLARETAHVMCEQANWVHPLVSFDFEGFAIDDAESE
ncbi:MAG: ParB/RepB/Spo0J family partition protein [Pseudomonadota bacterium]